MRRSLVFAMVVIGLLGLTVGCGSESESAGDVADVAADGFGDFTTDHAVAPDSESVPDETGDQAGTTELTGGADGGIDTISPDDIKVDNGGPPDVVEPPADAVDPEDADQEVVPDLPVYPDKCEENSDCPPDLVCEPMSEACVTCLWDLHCLPLHHCVDWQCKAFGPCEASEDCGESGVELICDVDKGECVECMGNDECAVAQECAAGKCIAIEPCQSTKDCPGDDICWMQQGKCVGCIDEVDCGEMEACGPDNTCTELHACTSDKACTPMDMVCDKAAGHCKECMGDGDCYEVYHCAGEACVPDVCDQGKSHCSGNAVVQCSDSGNELTVGQSCGEQQSCKNDGEVSACLDWVCPPGPPYCVDEGEAVVECAPDGLEIIGETPCEEEQACVNGECLKQFCEAGTSTCGDDGLSRVLCVAKGTAVLEEQCLDGTYCHLDEENETSVCLGQVCVPDQPTCDGSIATTCNFNGSAVLPDGTDCAEEELDCLDGDCILCEETETCDGIDNDCDGDVDEETLDCAGKNLCHLGSCIESPEGKCSVKAYGEHLYLVCKGKNFQWFQAQAYCQTWYESTLIIVQNEEEQSFLVSQTGQPVWIGYTDLETEGEWKWEVCCSDFAPWCPDEPNDWGQGEDCGGANFIASGEMKGCWNDYKCDQILADFVCEIQ